MSSSPLDPLVQLSGASRHFDQQVALHPVDLTIQAGDYWAVTGESGSGKTTLLNLVGLLDRPTSGDVLVAGQEAGRLSDAQRSHLRGRSLGFVFQAFHLLDSRTALTNVTLGMMYQGIPRAERADRARASLARVGLAHKMDAFPTTLSGGERQRVAIARALAAGAPLLLADEPTGNLDSANTDRIMELFRELNEDGLTLVVVTHSATVADHANQRLHLADGHVVPHPDGHGT